MALTREDRINRAISEINFREEVPADVVTRFEDVKDILDVARENERMLRVAIEYTMVTVELALRILSARLGHERAMEKDTKQTLPNFLEWLHKRDLLPHRSVEEPEDRPRSSDEEFNRDLPGMYKALRSLRNSWIHTRDASWLGWGFLRTIPQEAEFINRLYDAPRQRREARKKRRVVNGCCKHLFRNGAVLRHDDQRHLIHEVNMLYCDVSEKDDAYYFAMWPVFEPDYESGIHSEECAPYVAKCTSVCRGNSGKLELETRRGTSLFIDPDLEEQEEACLNGWDSREGRSIAFVDFLFSPGALRSYLLGLDRWHFPIFMDELKWVD